MTSSQMTQTLFSIQTRLLLADQPCHVLCHLCWAGPPPQAVELLTLRIYSSRATQSLSVPTASCVLSSPSSRSVTDVLRNYCSTKPFLTHTLMMLAHSLAVLPIPVCACFLKSYLFHNASSVHRTYLLRGKSLVNVLTTDVFKLHRIT